MAVTGRFIIYDYKKGGVKGIKECIEGSDFQLPLYYPAFINILKDAFGIEQPDCLALYTTALKSYSGTVLYGRISKSTV